MRTLTTDHRAIQEDDFRSPAFYVEIYDIVSTRGDAVPETINRVVQEDPTLTAPLDATPYINSIQMVERATDFVQGSIVGNNISFSFIDKRKRFDPVGGTEPNWLRAGNVIRIREGDGRSHTVTAETFNGTAVGVLGTYSVADRDILKSETLTVRQGSPTGTLLVEDTDYTVDLVNGTITGLGTHWAAATDYYINYEARDIPLQDWPFTFTGTLVGRAGADSRDRNENQILQLSAVDRTVSLLKITTTSAAFPQGTDYNTMMRTILEDEVGFSSAEFDIGTIGSSELTSQATTQFVDESPMISIAKIAFVFGFTPRFTGAGLLKLESTVSTKGAAVVYTDRKLFEGFTRPFNLLDFVNEVEVLGLSATLSKIEQPAQTLATASTTLGFFGGDESIRVRYSDDGTQQATGTNLNILSSVTGALIPFGEEDFTPVLDDDGGSRSGIIDVEGAFYAPLVISLYAGRIAASFIPDTFAGFGGGSTIPVGRIVEGVAAIAIATVQGTIGRGQYEVRGIPFEYVFREIRRVARVKDTPSTEIRSLTIENHLLDNDSFDEETQTGEDEVQDVANRELRNVRKRANKWNCRMKHDLRLEAYDKFSLPMDGTEIHEFIITGITRTLSRKPEDRAVNLELYETTVGVWP